VRTGEERKRDNDSSEKKNGETAAPPGNGEVHSSARWRCRSTGGKKIRRGGRLFSWHGLPRDENLEGHKMSGFAHIHEWYSMMESGAVWASAKTDKTVPYATLIRKGEKSRRDRKDGAS